MTERKARIGFFGVGNMGPCAHLKNYTQIRACEVVAIAEVREALGRQVAQRDNVARVYRTHEEMLAREQLDGIVAFERGYVQLALPTCDAAEALENLKVARAYIRLMSERVYPAKIEA